MKTYNEFIIRTAPINNESISGLLWQLDLDGIIDNDTYLTVYSTKLDLVNREAIEEILKRAKDESIIERFEVESSTHEDMNWNEEWEKKVNVIRVTDRLVIQPSFKDFDPKEDDIVIKIDPKMSFGTGEHATTKLVLGKLEKYINGGEKVLDIGSGTGVLAIASVLLGAKSAIALDNDEWCQLNGNENVVLNHLEDKVKIVLGELKDIKESDFDLVVANINRHILLDISKDIFAKTKKAGKLILSGLLKTDELEITNLYTLEGFQCIETIAMDEWICIVFAK
ncbi:MAG: 50S ribosomal protein L11 methyltransferase [Melioribacteraceae bacterium]